METNCQPFEHTAKRDPHGLVADWQPLRPGIGSAASGHSRVAPTRQDEPNRILEEQLVALQREHSELLRAVSVAAQAQRKLCAPGEARRGNFEIASEIFPVRHLSGDFSLLLDLGGATGLAVGDIAGKGLTAGLWLAHLAGLVRTHLGSGLDPAEAVAVINRELWKMQPESPMVALFLGRLDPRQGELIYSNAGQPAPAVLRDGGRVESLDAGGPMLGAVPVASFASGRVVLAPGDALISYSDGIVECRNDRGEEFGVERLVKACRGVGWPSAANMLFSVLGAAQDFAGGRAREDDLALMVVRNNGDRTSSGVSSSSEPMQLEREER
jgi:sigma-B regulation protein RsbU (phosphoserine phosphatase)